jgi:hypothetical protein
MTDELPKPKTQKDKLEMRRDLLDEYERSIGLPTNTPPGEENELQQYLNMTRNQIEALDAGTAVGISYRLSQFAFYFQRAINREKANKTWAENELKYIICKDLLQYDSYTPNKTELVCRENSAARELRSIGIYAQQRIERLEEISAGLRSLSFSISNVAKNRMGEHK